MGAIYRREMASYFHSPVVYIYLAVFNFFAGLFLTTSCLMYQTTDMSGVFGNMFMILIFLIPVLTMKLLSEEKKQKTDQCLFTAPISLTGVVMGKFLAAFTVFGISLLFILLYGVIMSIFSPVEWAVVFGNLTGLLLLGGAFIAAGLFVSSLTESQVVSAIGGFILIMGMYLIEMLAMTVSNETMQKIIMKLSFFSKYTEFSSGIFNVADAFYFLSVAAVFIFLTIKSLEKKRYS